MPKRPPAPASKPAPARPIGVGDRIRLDWPKSPYHGATGKVRLIDGDQAGVVWDLCDGQYYARQRVDRIQRIGKGEAK